MIEKQIEKIKEKIGIDEALTYKEDDHYYILYNYNNVCDGILIQELNSNTIVVWCYDVPKKSKEVIISIIISCFDCNIIFPFIEEETTFFYLLNNGFKKYDYKDDLIDKEIKKYPSVILERRDYLDE